MLLQFILGMLIYVLGCYCIISVAAVFGLLLTFTQALAVMLLFSIVVAIAKNT
jgi:hypothetical protein